MQCAEYRPRTGGAETLIGDTADGNVLLVPSCNRKSASFNMKSKKTRLQLKWARLLEQSLRRLKWALTGTETHGAVSRGCSFLSHLTSLKTIPKTRK